MLALSGCFKVLLVGAKVRRAHMITHEASPCRLMDRLLLDDSALMGGVSIGFFVYQVQKATR